jgi:hypothetical protein
MDHPFLLSCRLADWKDRVEQVKSKGQLGVANWPSTVGMKVDATHHGKKHDQIRRHRLSADTQRYWLAGLAGLFDLSNCAVLLVTGVMKLSLSLL